MIRLPQRRFFYKKFIVFLLSIIPVIVLGQNADTSALKEINKLEKKLKQLSPEQKAESVLRLSELYWHENPNKSIEYGKLATVLLKEQHSNKVPDAMINTAIGFYYLGRADSTIYYTEKLFEDYKMLLTDHKSGASHNLLCVAYREIGDYKKALDHGDKALHFFNKTKDSIRISGTLDNIAMIHEKIGNYKKSLMYSIQSLHIFEKKKDTANIAATHFNIANLYATLKNYSKVEEHLRLSARLSKKTDDKFILADIYNNFGTLYIETQRYDSAYVYLQKAKKNYKEIHAKSGIAVATQNIGLVFFNKKQYVKAAGILKQAIHLFTKLNAAEDLVDAYADLGEVYYYLKQYKQAEHYLDLSLRNASKIKNSRLRLKSLKRLRDLSEKNKDYKQAYLYEKRYINLKDSIENIEIKTQIAELDKKYQTEKKEKAIALLKSNEKIQQARNRTIIILSLGLLSFILLVFYSILQKRKKERAIVNLQLQQAQLKEQQLEKELEFKNKQLASQAINIMHRNKMLQNYLNIINDIAPVIPENKTRKIRNLKRDIKRTILSKKDWDSFTTYFEKTNESFVKSFKKMNPDITNNDMRLAALIRLGMTNKEIAGVYNISPQSVKNALYRLKKKINLGDSVSLRSFIMDL